MRNYFALFAALLLAMCLVGSLSAQSTGPVGTSTSGNGFCNFVYTSPSGTAPGNNGVTSANSNWTSYAGLLGYAVLIILAMLVLMGFVYGVGRAFQIQKFTEFAKTEYLESVANLVIILLILGGMTAVFNLVIYTSDIALIGAAAIPPGQTTTQIPPITSSSQMYSTLCSNYINNLLGAVGDLSQVYLVQLVLNFLANFAVEFNVPQGQTGGAALPFVPGVSVMPLQGLFIESEALGIVSGAAFFVGVLNLGMVFLLFIIYYIFPLFLYLGILLRSFPWTRAAGGAFLALFISFYVVFPALLYPFSFPIQSPTLNTLNIPALNGLTGGKELINFASNLGGQVLGTVAQSVPIVNGAVPGDFAFKLLQGAINISSDSFLQLIGFIIALLISYDMLEMLADLLGAPSMQSRNILKKLI